MIRAAYRLLWVWPMRVALAFLWFFGLMSPSLYLAWLRWQQEDMGPKHPKAGDIAIEISQVRDLCAR